MSQVKTIHTLINRNDSDFNKLNEIATFFAREQGAEVILTPKMSRPPKFKYECVYASLVGTKYEGKCPDLRINGIWYEHEGFTSDKPKRAFSNMMNHGLKQSSRIIIDKPDLTDGFMIRSFYGRINKGYVIDEVWIREQDGKIRLLFRKDKHLS